MRMVDLVDVSKCFDFPAKVNPDYVQNVGLYYSGTKYQFTFADFRLTYHSKYYEDKKTAEYEMEQFCKKIQSEI